MMLLTGLVYAVLAETGTALLVAAETGAWGRLWLAVMSGAAAEGLFACLALTWAGLDEFRW